MSTENTTVGRTRGLSRRAFVGFAGLAALTAGGLPGLGWRRVSAQTPAPGPGIAPTAGRVEARPVRLFLCGDVMTGRGIDQLMRRAVDPRLYEPYITDARDYLRLAEAHSGPIDRPAQPAYPWGDALRALAAAAPDARIVNLETAITDGGTPWPGKGIHYRMHPANVALLEAAAIDCCVLANNHVLDWGYDGLAQTTASLAAAGIRTAGAGADLARARAPAVMAFAGGGRTLVFAMASASSGVPGAWAAGADRPGLHLIDEASTRDRQDIIDAIAHHRRAGDLVVVSVHWGGNWGYAIPQAQKAFARALIDTGLVDLVHGHSSHHVKGIEVYRGRPVFYGCGDLLNDYEGIGGHAAYRGDLGLLYLPTLDPEGGGLRACELVPMQIRRLRLQRAGTTDARWLAATLTREGRRLGTRVRLRGDGRLELAWRTRQTGR